jgi:hypothetical protein
LRDSAGLSPASPYAPSPVANAGLARPSGVQSTRTEDRWKRACELTIPDDADCVNKPNAGKSELINRTRQKKRKPKIFFVLVVVIGLWLRAGVSEKEKRS